MNPMKIMPYCKTITRGNRTIIVNTYSGKWIKISNECFDILKLAESKFMSESQLINCFTEDGDRAYFIELIKKLHSLQIISNRDFLDMKVRAVGLNITHRCNLSCKHCSIEAGNAYEKEFLDTEHIFKIIDHIIECQPMLISISGGEPLIREDFFEIMRYLKSKFNGNLSLMTNSLLLSQKNINEIANLFTNIEISIDGVDEETCSLVRGKGVFNNVINRIKLLQSIGFEKISLSMVDTVVNSKNKLKFLELNNVLGTKPIIRVFTPYGRGDENKKDFINTDIVNDSNHVKYETNQNEYKRFGINGFSCGAIINKIQISYDGNIFPCAALQMPEFSLGNILHIKNLKNYLDNKEYINNAGYKQFQSILPTNSEKCKDCDVNLFCQKCPLNVYIYKKNTDMFETLCNIRKNECEIVWR